MKLQMRYFAIIPSGVAIQVSWRVNERIDILIQKGQISLKFEKKISGEGFDTAEPLRHFRDRWPDQKPKPWHIIWKQPPRGDRRNNQVDTWYERRCGSDVRVESGEVTDMWLELNILSASDNSLLTKSRTVTSLVTELVCPHHCLTWRTLTDIVSEKHAGCTHPTR
jgi:hypothetical protein